MAANESTPLASAKPLYFIPKNRTFTEEIPEDDGGEVELSDQSTTAAPEQQGGGGFLGLFGGGGSSDKGSESGYSEVSNPVTTRAALPRKVPVKVEPKVFFSNERTFLAWTHMSVIMASISIGIVALAEQGADGQVTKAYGVALMPVSIAFAIYALHMYLKRTAMLMRRDPGPFDDRVGPTVLGGLLIAAICANVGVKMYSVIFW